jgi:hypothetical protein
MVRSRPAQIFTIIALVVATLSLGGCGIELNRVDLVDDVALRPPKGNRALVVVGVGIDAEKQPSGFDVYLTQVTEEGFITDKRTGSSVIQTKTTAECWGLFSATVSDILAKARGPSIVRYVYSVPAGHYAFRDEWLRPPFGVQDDSTAAETPSFFAPPGSVTYFGDFIYRGDLKNREPWQTPGAPTQFRPDVELRRDIPAVRNWLRNDRKFKGELAVAEIRLVIGPSMILCTP